MERCAFDRGEKCSVLKGHECGKCTFRKTRDELINGRDKARERIDNLPREQYDAIMQKYYCLRRDAGVAE
jgi:hypothetical protein